MHTYFPCQFYQYELILQSDCLLSDVGNRISSSTIFHGTACTRDFFCDAPGEPERESYVRCYVSTCLLPALATRHRQHNDGPESANGGRMVTNPIPMQDMVWGASGPTRWSRMGVFNTTKVVAVVG